MSKPEAPRGAFNQKEAAHYVRLALSTFKEVENEGRGPPFFREGRSKLYPRALLDAWMARRCAEQAGAKVQAESMLAVLDGGMA